MASYTKRLTVAVLAGMALGILAAPAAAQIRIMPNSSNLVNPVWRVGPLNTPLNQAAYNTAVFGNAMSQVPPWVYGYNPYPQVANYGPVYNPMLANQGLPLGGASLTSNPAINSALYSNGYGSSPGMGYNSLNNNSYYPGYYPPPYYSGDYTLGATLQGMGSVISAQGQFNIQNQQAKLIQQQELQAKVDTRRKVYEEWLYEQANMPSLQDRREQLQRYELRRAMKDPPLVEILSGTSLDAIYKDLLTKQAQWPKGPQWTIDDSVLKRINWSSGAGGNAGMLKKLRDGEPLPWPAALKTPAFAREVTRIDTRMKDAVNQAEIPRRSMPAPSPTCVPTSRRWMKW